MKEQFNQYGVMGVAFAVVLFVAVIGVGLAIWQDQQSDDETATGDESSEVAPGQQAATAELSDDPNDQNTAFQAESCVDLDGDDVVTQRQDWEGRVGQSSSVQSAVSFASQVDEQVRVGTHCEMLDESSLVSFTVFEEGAAADSDRYFKGIAQFGTGDALVLNTDTVCLSADPDPASPPFIQSISGGIIEFTCLNGDTEEELSLDINL